MAESLFDSRYRYDYIYPRGRSGETLRAVDTQNNNRPVVIKRPAPNDAPPIRAGQEVSILNERKALSRLSGQAALTALLGSGQFHVGGVTHQYIVMERAEGIVVADHVLELAKRGERMAELEMLVIVDALLGLLSAAHAQDIVYNDVDAKHLFWNREHYRLKVIDWGNAVFLEGDEITPQGVSRQSDIYQVGELLYFILSGGSRVDIPRDVGDDFRLDFGYDAERVHTRLQSIVGHAVHPNLKLRYRSIDELRKDLTDYRQPLERERNQLLNRVADRLRRDRSRDELQSLLKTLEPALEMDPGYPPANETRREILNRLSDLEVDADLDAARIYLESGNWTRAIGLLDELHPRARGTTAELITLLLDWATLMVEADVRPTPPAILDAIVLVFEGHAARAATHLVTQVDGDETTRHLQWLLAERITAHLPDVLLLRPSLYRLSAALDQLAEEEYTVGEPRLLLAEIIASLDDVPPSGDVSLIDLRDRYRSAVDKLTALGTLLEAVSTTYGLTNRKLPLHALERALNAAMALADNMHVIGKQATASPRDALAALDNSRAIEPVNPTWDRVGTILNQLYEKLGAYQIYVPVADGSDLELWLSNAQSDLEPFSERLFDEMLVSIIRGLATAERAWGVYANAALQGNRHAAITSLTQAIDAISTVSPTLAGWLNQTRTVVQGAQHVERHALYGGLGRALADGWEAYDRGRLADAERLGGQAYEIARNDPERFAARRLRDLAEATRGWVERNGVTDAKRTQTVLATVELLYTTDENNTRNNFSSQMPSKETYLKAMSKGLVELYQRSSSAALRILFFNFLLLGTLDAHEGALEDAAFWREAALRTLGEGAPKHPATRTLDDFLEKRRDLKKAEELLATINGPQALKTLDSARKQLEDNPQNRSLAAAVFSLRELEASLRDWSDGEFRAAGIKLENAVKALDELETQAQISVTNYRAWLMNLIAAAAELHSGARSLAQTIEKKPDEPQESVRAAHRKQVDMTTRLLGEAYAANLRQWRDTYEQFLAVYTDRSARRSARLNRFNELFRAMFIDRHPAYPLYRHWYDVTEHAPEFPAPPTSEPVPQPVERVEPVAPPKTAPTPVPVAPPADDLEPPLPAKTRGEAEPSRRRSRRLPIMALGAIAAALAIIAVAVLASGNDVNAGVTGVPLTVTDMPAGNPTQPPAAAVTEEPTTEPTRDPGFILFTSAPPASATTVSRALPTATPTTEAAALAPTMTPTVAPPTSTPTAVPPTPIPPTPEPLPTVPPGGLTGRQNLLAAVGRVPRQAWASDQFSPSTEAGVWRLGSGSDQSGGDVIVVPFPPELLETFYGNNAAARIRSMEATLALTTYVPELLAAQEVYFGAVFADANDPTQTIGIQVVLNQPGIINLGQRQGADVRLISQRSVTAPVVRVRLERDPVSGVMTVYYNNEQLGQPVLFTDSPDDPIVPVLFVRNGGVIVSVTEWTVILE